MQATTKNRSTCAAENRKSSDQGSISVHWKGHTKSSKIKNKEHTIDTISIQLIEFTENSTQTGAQTLDQNRPKPSGPNPPTRSVRIENFNTGLNGATQPIETMSWRDIMVIATSQKQRHNKWLVGSFMPILARDFINQSEYSCHKWSLEAKGKRTKASWARRDVYPENMWCAATCLGSIFELKNWEKGRAKWVVH